MIVEVSLSVLQGQPIPLHCSLQLEGSKVEAGAKQEKPCKAALLTLVAIPTAEIVSAVGLLSSIIYYPYNDADIQ